MTAVKSFCLFLPLALALTACDKPASKQQKTPHFIVETQIKATPVKHQGQSNLCWAYAMLATIESERIMIGDSVNLSADYIARMMLQDETIKYYISQGKNTISLRGIPMMTIHLMEKYGAMPYDSYNTSGETNYNVLCRKLMMTANSQRNITTLNSRITDEIDQNIDYLPKNIYMLGAQYSPIEFAHSLFKADEYVALTSFTHHPFNQKFALEVPDNKMNDTFLNVPIDTFMRHIETALRSGHPVCWEGDITEPSFSFAKGIATVGNYREITQQNRQQEFERWRTTDDHCMELVGIAHDEMGKKYIIAKNSWGTNNAYKGFMYLSEGYIKLKTIAVYMSKNAFNYANSR